MIDLQDIIKTKRELLSRETYSRNPINYSAGMAEDQKDRYIQYLAEQNQDLRLTGDAMKLVLEDFMAQMKELKAQMSSMQSKHADLENRLSEEHKLRKSAERKIKSLQEKLDYAHQERFGDRRQKIQSKAKTSDSDRRKEKDNYDGTDDTLRTDSVGHVPSQELKEPSGKDRDLSNRPDGYKTMGVAGEATEHPSDLTKVPGRIIERRMVRVFSFRTFLTEECFEMVHYAEPGKKPKWGYFPSEGHPEVVTSFEGTRATPEFLQAIAYEVYVKNVTFGLLHQWLTDMGMTISKNTLRNWLKKGKTYLDELVCVLKSIALEKDSIVNCDETWCKVRKYDHYKKCYMWVLVNKAERLVIFFYEDGSRGRDVLTNFLGDAELKALMSDGYNAYVFIGDELKTHRYKDTDHQVYLAHVRAKFVKARMEGGDKRADVFLGNINRLFRFEREYDREMITDGERTRRRQGLPTMEAMINLRANLLQELKSEEEQKSCYMREALNYLHKFWNEAFTYIKDGRYPISNNLAERAVRPFTTKRKNSLHFGSDEGAEIAAVYHSIISTVKLQGRSAWDYLGKFFTGIFNGCRDFLSLTPQNIDLAVCQ
jgi:transposase